MLNYTESLFLIHLTPLQKFRLSFGIFSKGKEKSVAQLPSYKADIISIYKQLLYSYVSYMWLSISRVNTKCNNAIPYRIYSRLYIKK